MIAGMPITMLGMRLVPIVGLAWLLPACSAQVGGQRCSAQRDTCTDARSDVDGPSGSSHCFGSGLIGNLCFTTPPSGTSTLTVAIDTATVGSGDCSEIRAQTGGPSLCVIAAETIQVSGVVKVTGANPLVLIANTTITIGGTLDAASHAAIPGGGARATCGAVGLDGTISNDPNGGGGGGAGGSFGGAGGPGGNGRQGAQHGTPTGPVPATVLIGGCPGGRGGAGNGGGGEGSPGSGGGAVYLIANSSITISGALDASGAGGGGGGDGLNSAAGGGGGGAGGMIGLDAPSITVTGSVFANGGGGGGGGGGQAGNVGTPGADPTAAQTAAAGGQGGQGGGGNGGLGSVGTTTGGTGTNGNQQYTAGGGGGGGAGVIHVYRAAASSIGGNVSPPPT